MQNAMWITTIVLLLGNLGFLVFILKRLAAKDKTQDELLVLRELVANLEKVLGAEVPRLEKAIKDEVRASRDTTANTLTVQLRETAGTLVGVVGKLGEGQSQHLEGVIKSIETTVNTLVTTVGELGETQTQELANVTKSVNNLTQANETRIENVRNTLNEGLHALQTSNENKLELIRQSVNEQLHATGDTLTSTVGELGEAQTRQLETVKNSVDSTAKTLVNTVAELGQTQTRQLEDVKRTIDGLTQANETSIEKVRTTLTEELQALQTSNENKLELIRQSVNEQLHATGDTLTSTVGELGEAQTRQLETVKNSVDSTAKTLVNTVAELGQTQTRQLEDVKRTIDGLTQANETSIEKVRTTLTEELQALQTSNENKLELIRQSVNEQLQTTSDTLVRTVGELGETQKRQLDSGTKAINELTQTNETRIENVRNTLTEGLQALQTSNENKLELIRQTVDEQLQSTLAKRIGESFNLVSTQLAEVERGLGEMRNLATEVGDLQRVMGGIRTRGNWGEVQLGTILEQVLTPDQYDTNVRIKAHSQEVVEFAIRLPGTDSQPGSRVWLPIDSKFPLASYEKLVEAADPETKQQATKAFFRRVESEAKKIQEKYVVPPQTTDFAIMFLPTEGLYAEVLRRRGQVEKLQTEYRIIVAGPTTLAAILSGLRMGFRTLAIQKRSSEVWKLLAAVKTEFGKFTDVLEKLKTQLNRAYNTIDVDTGRRVRAIHNKLQTVEELPLETAAAELGIPNEEQIDKGDTDE